MRIAMVPEVFPVAEIILQAGYWQEIVLEGIADQLRIIFKTHLFKNKRFLQVQSESVQVLAGIAAVFFLVIEPSSPRRSE